VRRSLDTVKGVTRTTPRTARSARTLALPPFVAGIFREALDHREELRQASGMT
jgi:hypothetical protein